MKKWLLIKQKANESPNFYTTDNFVKFKRITDIQPQKRYNWINTELVSFSQLDGIPSQGILFKPENLDSSLAYPIIFNYYEKNSYGLNYSRFPEFAMNQINIPWFVSNGYLVFVPDIYFRKGNQGVSAYNSVLGAVEFLSVRRYIDKSRMALVGQSFAGYETNYIVTHSPIFSAALSSSGVSNIIDLYNGFVGSNPFGQENGQKFTQNRANEDGSNIVATARFIY